MKRPLPPGRPTCAPFFGPGDFEKLSAFDKGYAVYRLGALEDEPHMPESYAPTEAEREEYERGQYQGMLDTVDEEE